MRDRLAAGAASISAARVARAQPDIVEALLVDRRQQLGDAVDERLAADEADIGILARLRDQMLAAAEADLEPDFARRKCEQGLARGERRDIHFEPRQQLRDEARVMGAQRLAPAAAINSAAPVRAGLGGVGFAARRERRQDGSRDYARPRNCSARSVFSQEKPPSASGVRPKWP